MKTFSGYEIWNEVPKPLRWDESKASIVFPCYKPQFEDGAHKLPIAGKKKNNLNVYRI